MPTDDEDVTEEGSGDNHDNDACEVGIGTHTHEKEWEQRMKRLKEVINEEWTKNYESCPIRDCGFMPPQESIDEFDFNEEMLKHLTVRHPDYCILCKVNTSLLFSLIGCHAKIDNGNPVTYVSNINLIPR